MAFYPSVQEVVQNFKKTPLVHKSDKKQTLDKKADTKVVIVAESGEYYDDYTDYNEGGYYNVWSKVSPKPLILMNELHI